MLVYRFYIIQLLIYLTLYYIKVLIENKYLCECKITFPSTCISLKVEKLKKKSQNWQAIFL